MKTVAICMVLSLLVAGCASRPPKPIATDRATQTVACVPGRVDLCHARAQQACPGGYDEVKTENAAVAARPPASGATAAAAAADATPTSLVISCR